MNARQDTANETETPPIQEKDGIGWAHFFMWPFIILLIYVLSIGPVLLLDHKGRINRAIGPALESFYAPVGYAYDETFLKKPLGLYFYLWDPEDFDANGNGK